MAQRKEEPDPERFLAFLQHVANGVVDRGNVVRIERMAKSEHVRDEAEADQRGMAAGVVEVEPPAKQMQKGDEPVQTGEPSPLACGERKARAAHGPGRSAGVDVVSHGCRPFGIGLATHYTTLR